MDRAPAPEFRLAKRLVPPYISVKTEITVTLRGTRMNTTRLPTEPPPALTPAPAAAAAPGGPRVLVLGGAGFIGRHAVAALLARGLPVEIGSRHPDRVAHRLPPDARFCPRRRTHFEDLIAPEDWADVLADIDVVVNC